LMLESVLAGKTAVITGSAQGIGVPPVFRTADQIGSDLERVKEIGWEIHEIQPRVS